MEAFIQKLIAEGVLKSKPIIRAFKQVQRADFVPRSIRLSASEDVALPTFADQTISQPYTVAFMLEQLRPRPGQKILDVGSGSGWVAALLAQIVGPKGYVWGIERGAEVVEFSQDNLRKYKLKNIKILLGDGTQGLMKVAPFDRIHVAAAAQKIPAALKRQLTVGGRMIIPTQKNDIRLVEKKSKTRYTEKIYPGFVFVPLVD